MNPTQKDRQPPTDIRHHRLSFRVTDQERQQIEDDAERAGVTVGAYIRQVLLDAPVPRQSKRPPVEKKELARLLGHIGKIGSNINQLARAANANIPVSSLSLQAELDALKQLRLDIKNALGKT